MLSKQRKSQLKTVSLIGIIASFVLLYLGPVTFDSTPITVLGLVLAGITAVVAWFAF